MTLNNVLILLLKSRIILSQPRSLSLPTSKNSVWLYFDNRLHLLLALRLEKMKGINYY